MRHRFDFAQTATWLVAALFLFLGVLQLPAASTTLNYQGRVIANGVAFQGTGQFKFALISSDGSTYYWKNDGSTGATDPASAVSLAVNRGLFSIRLGDTAIPNMTALDSAVLANAGVKLRVWFNDGVKGFQQMNPDHTVNQTTGTSTNNSKSVYSSPGLTDPNGYLAMITPGRWEKISKTSVNGKETIFVRDNNDLYSISLTSASSKPSGTYRIEKYRLETSTIETVCSFSFTAKTQGVNDHRFKTGQVIQGILWLSFLSTYSSPTPNSSFSVQELVAIDLSAKKVVPASGLSQPNLASVKAYSPMSVTVGNETYNFLITNSSSYYGTASSLKLSQGTTNKNIENSGISMPVNDTDSRFPSACAFEYGDTLFFLSGSDYWYRCPIPSLHNMFIAK
jgi:hypothetical protein